MIDIDSLTVDERLELIEKLWDSLNQTADMNFMSDAQRAELDRRLDQLDRDGPNGVPIEEALARFPARPE